MYILVLCLYLDTILTKMEKVFGKSNLPSKMSPSFITYLITSLFILVFWVIVDSLRNLCGIHTLMDLGAKELSALHDIVTQIASFILLLH